MSKEKPDIDPLALAIQALNDIPNTRFRSPVGPFKTTYELVSFFEEVSRYTDEWAVISEEDPRAPFVGEIVLYAIPIY